MNAPNVDVDEYTDPLIAAPNGAAATAAARAQPLRPDAPAHDAFTRLLHRREPDPDTLWAEARSQVTRAAGGLGIDDATPDTPDARHIDLVTRQWSGKHHAVAQGVNRVTLLRTDGDRHIPCDYRVYDAAHRRTKNDHFADVLRAAHARGFRPGCVRFDGWCGSPENLNLVRACGWTWRTRLESNRLVNRDRPGTRAVKDTAIAATGTEVWLPGFGRVKVCGLVAPDGDTAYRATNDLGMTDLTRSRWAEFSWAIERCHRGLKQCTGVERCRCRSATAPRDHIGWAIRAFVRLEVFGFARGVSWVEAKAAIIRPAVRAYLARPRIRLPYPATA